MANRRSMESDLRNIPSSFKVHCKTTEFHQRLNLPPVAREIFGTEEKVIDIQCGYDGCVFSCTYQFHQIQARGFNQLSMGWSNVVDAMEIGQGDLMYFVQDWEDPKKFHLFVNRQHAAIKIEGVGWI